MSSWRQLKLFSDRLLAETSSDESCGWLFSELALADVAVRDMKGITVNDKLVKKIN